MRAKLEDVCVRGSSSLKQSDVIDKTGEYPIYGAAGYIGNVDFYHQDQPYIAVVKDGAGIGRTSLYPAKSSVIGTMQYLLPKENVLPEYLCYVVKYMHLEKYFTGATIPHIYFKDYKKEEFNLDILDRQKEIVNILGRIECVISSRQQELQKLDELIKARFVEMFGDPYVNPLKWKKLKIKDAVTIEPQNGLYKPQSDYVTDGTGIPILRIDGFYDGMVTDFASLKRLKCSETERQRYLLLEDDIVINRVNSIEYLGKCAHIKELLEDTVYESNMMRMHFDPEYYNPVYICKLLCSQFIYDQIVNHAKKSVNQASINQKDVLDFNIYQPPLDLQNEFADFVHQVNKSKVVVSNIS
ncbi:restriction endonuclease subunit S [Blautia obeum]|uniref:Restriction endonuclease S subunits n=2 Tax=Blautia TaxID=572511 RepID=D4LTP7_9FIRM|nr:restriction endonuclease subunit S [Blautia obeum]CBL24155.1 Restriction endonuclease S subunits [Blautia obeum A2-162]